MNTTIKLISIVAIDATIVVDKAEVIAVGNSRTNPPAAKIKLEI